jgi:hypothetical protein
MKQKENREGNGKLLSRERLTALLLGTTVAALAVLLGSYVVRADEDGAGNPMGAARLSSVEGQVRLMQEGQVIAESAPVNAPLFAGTQIETGDDGKAEVQFEDGSLARISPDSALTIRSIGGDGSDSTDLALDKGLAYFELRGNMQNGQTHVLFGDSIATVSGFTVLRVRMDTPPGEMAVFSGNAHLERGNLMAVDLHGGQSLTFDASDPNHYNLIEGIEPDSWDTWNSDRDQALSATASEQTGAAGNFVNNESPNAEWNDLDANGSWYNVPGQGYVWSPFVASGVGWDPYGCGHWMWTPRFGYIWVSCESWGYLPYSCGSWNFYNGFGWGWAPGMGGCTPWWRRGTYVGWNVGTPPSWYHPIPRPVLRHPNGRNPIPVINVTRSPQGGPNELPQRGMYNPVQIAGSEVMPMRRLPVHDSYVRSSSGFVYHPPNTYQGQRDGGQVVNDHPADNNRRGYQRNQAGDSYVRPANPGPVNSYTPPPSQGNGRDRNDNQPPVVNTQPGRMAMPPGQNRGEPGRTYTPPTQPVQPRPEPGRQYTPPPQQRYTPPPAPQPQQPTYTPPPQPRYTPPPQPQQPRYNPPPQPQPQQPRYNPPPQPQPQQPRYNPPPQPQPQQPSRPNTPPNQHFSGAISTFRVEAILAVHLTCGRLFLRAVRLRAARLRAEAALTAAVVALHTARTS